MAMSTKKPIPTNPAHVLGHQIQIDRSGKGHAWKNISAEDIPCGIVLEIEGEIIDGKRDATELLIGSNGMHYRWPSLTQ